RRDRVAAGIARERLYCALAAGTAGRVGVVDRVLVVGGGHVGEIAVHLVAGGHETLVEDGFTVAPAFIGPEEEDLVSQDRATERSAELVLYIVSGGSGRGGWGSRRASPYGAEIAEGIAGVEDVVADELPC